MIKEKLKIFWLKFKKLLFPELTCYICGRELENPELHICENCDNRLDEITGMYCEICGDKLDEPDLYCEVCKHTKHSYNTARSCYVYDKYSGALVTGLKYNNKKFLVPFMAKKMFKRLVEFPLTVDTIIPVPLTVKRRRARGFNQSELLADEIARLSPVPMVVDTVSVTRNFDRPPQATLNRAERLKNLKGIFSVVDTSNITGKVVLIVDDVYTTGATVEELSRVILKKKPKTIYVLTFARTQFHKKTKLNN